jgi:hypothetical protein
LILDADFRHHGIPAVEIDAARYPLVFGAVYESDAAKSNKKNAFSVFFGRGSRGGVIQENVCALSRIAQIFV